MTFVCQARKRPRAGYLVIINLARDYSCTAIKSGPNVYYTHQAMYVHALGAHMMFVTVFYTSTVEVLAPNLSQRVIRIRFEGMAVKPEMGGRCGLIS